MRFMCTLFLLCGFCLKGLSQQSIPPQSLNKIEQNLNSIETLKARFIQKDDSQTLLSGTFYLVRPWKIRFEYDSDAPYLIVGDGNSLIYEDYITQHVTFFSAETLLPPLLTKKNISLEQDVKILKSWIEDGSYFLLIKNDAGGQILFEFGKDHHLKGWTTHDAFGKKIKISFLRLEKNIPLSDELFTYRRSPSLRKNKSSL